MKYTCVISSPGADLRGGVVCRNENWVGREEVVKSVLAHRAELSKLLHLSVSFFSPVQGKG